MNQCVRATRQVVEDRQKEEHTGLNAEYDHHGLSPDSRQNIANQHLSRVDQTETGSPNKLIYRTASEPEESEAAFGTPADNPVKHAGTRILTESLVIPAHSARDVNAGTGGPSNSKENNSSETTKLDSSQKMSVYHPRGESIDTETERFRCEMRQTRACDPKTRFPQDGHIRRASGTECRKSVANDRWTSGDAATNSSSK